MNKIPSVKSALKFRAEQMGWNDSEMARQIGIQRSHYSEILAGKRPLSLTATRKAFHLGVPAKVLLQLPKTSP